MSAPLGPPPGPPDMSNVDPGLQPTLIALLYLFPSLALAVLIVRFWKKQSDRILGGGKILSRQQGERLTMIAQMMS
jgi:hypothetical protein